MAKATGAQWDVAISAADSDASYTEIGEIKSVTFDDVKQTVDATTNDDAPNMTSLYTLNQATVAVTVAYDKSDAGQLAVQQMNEGRLFRFIRARPNNATGERERIFRALITGYSESGATAALKELSVTFTSDGAVTYADLP